MAIDDTKISYSNTWDIDQLIATAEVSVGTAAVAIYTFTTANPPYFEVQFKPTGSSKWFQPGTNSTNNLEAGLFSFKVYISGSSIFIDVDGGSSGITGGTARYFVWSDKVNY